MAENRGKIETKVKMMRASETKSQRHIAKDFTVSETQVCHILKRKAEHLRRMFRHQGKGRAV